MEITQVPAALVAEVAMGATAPDATARKYGYSQEEFLTLMTMPWFHRLLSEARARLESEGFTFKNKVTALAEDMLVDAYNCAKKSVDGDLKLDVAKYLSKIAGFEPAPGQVAVGGGSGGFSVTINFTNQQQTLVVEAAAVIDELPRERPVIDMPVSALIDNETMTQGLEHVGD